MHFFSFFDVLPSVPTTTGMTLMLLMFHIILIFLFSSWHLSIFSFSFSLTLMSPGIAISIMAQLLSFLFTTTISGFLALISVILDHNIVQSLNFFIFNNTFWSMFIPFFTLYQVVFPTQFPMNYSWNIIVPSCTPVVGTFCIRSQYEILFHFSCHTFYKVVIVLFYQYCVLHSLLKLLVLVQHKTWLLFQLSSELFSASTMFPFHLLFLALLLETVPISFCFFHSSFFPLIRLFEFILIHCIIILCCFCSFHTFNQWLN